MEGDLKEPGAFTLSPFETGTGAAAAVRASELKIGGQLSNQAIIIIKQVLTQRHQKSIDAELTSEPLRG